MIDKERLARAVFLHGMPPEIEVTYARANPMQYGELVKESIEIVDIILANIKAQQHAVVPREPTEAMLKEGNIALGLGAMARTVWPRMLSAAEEGG